ncbi:GNAT family N-acetyltransferase [Loktanella sp. S4079]|uniref:GNAT family N-acetyltransferase n=1 Tax=Loktanella sp. S4079 TaxID=579483 RepID=UPI0005FA2271|nr:GNAT family N-acetyltransferase [Loktanella sp. S4079]KJZ19992.1 hypothetical protein TW80_03830 [Loktanella sp. S4079]
MTTVSPPLQQHPNFRLALAQIGVKTFECDLRCATPVQCIRRFGLNAAMRGPVWKSPHADHAELHRSNLRLINSDGGDTAILQKAGFRQIMTPAHVAELALSDDILTTAKPKWRNIWRQSQRGPIAISTAPFHAKHHDWLLQADQVQQKQKRFRALPHEIIHAYAKTAPYDVKVWSAYLNKEPIAGMLFLRHGDRVTYHLGWSGALGRKHAAHYAMIIHAALYFNSHGVRQMDLGTVDTHNAPGLARFKIGTGALIRPLGGTWLRLP